MEYEKKMLFLNIGFTLVTLPFLSGWIAIATAGFGIFKAITNYIN
jgi:hypothetical protein